MRDNGTMTHAEIDLKGMEGEEGEWRGGNFIPVHYMHTWKYDNETPLYH
jgi:hypothetical protein